MSTQTTPHQSFPAPCKRCGGALYQHADRCPYCGTTHPLDDRPLAPFGASAAAATATAGAQHHPFGPDTQTDGAPPDLASPDTPIPPLGHGSPGSTNGTRTLVTRGLIGIVVLMLGYGAYTLFGGHSSAPADNEEDTQSTGGTVAAYTPGSSSNTSSGGSIHAQPHAGGTNQPANNAAPAPQVVVQPAPVPHYRDLSESLHAARVHRDANDVSGAQAAVNAAFAMQANSADAQLIQHELAPLEQRRNAALQTALVCVKDNLWNCVEHSARDALAIDTGSVEAKALLERAIVETGWAPLRNKPAPVAHAAPVTQAAGTQTLLPPLPPLPPAAAQPAPAAPAAKVAPTAPADSTAPTTPAANSVDAQERAIAQYGWKDSPAPGTPPASAAAASQ